MVGPELRSSQEMACTYIDVNGSDCLESVQCTDGQTRPVVGDVGLQ